MAALSAVDNFVTVNIGFQDYILDIHTRSCKLLSEPESGIIKDNEETAGKGGMDFHGGDSRTIIMRYCCALSNCSKWYASVTSKKRLLLWETNSWTLVSNRKIERAASRVIFTPSSDFITLADKTGDVYLFSVKEPSVSGQLILGHVSVLLDVLITPDEKFIITCDRDDKVRISHYPNSYNICSFCLGHTEFVTKVSLLDANLLVSASGDGTLRFWDFKVGKELFTYPVSQDIIEDCGIRKQLPLEVEDDDHLYPITYLSSTFKLEGSSVICVSVNGFSKVFVYNVVTDPLSIECIQKIELHSEPFTFCLTKTGNLWVLLPSITNNCIPSLKAFVWRNEMFYSDKSDEIECSINSMNELFNVNRCEYYQNVLSGLYKMPKDKQKFKRMKTE